jgi:hypothetical protein
MKIFEVIASFSCISGGAAQPLSLPLLSWLSSSRLSRSYHAHYGRCDRDEKASPVVRGAFQDRNAFQNGEDAKV